MESKHRLPFNPLYNQRFDYLKVAISIKRHRLFPYALVGLPETAENPLKFYNDNTSGTYAGFQTLLYVGLDRSCAFDFVGNIPKSMLIHTITGRLIKETQHVTPFSARATTSVQVLGL